MRPTAGSSRLRTTSPHSKSIAAPWPVGSLIAPALLVLSSFALYAINIDRAPHPDELYHILAARGLLEYGEPRIAEGLYTRVLLHTWLIAQSFALFGESLTAARLPSMIALALANALLFVWLRRAAGSRAAWLGAGLFMISPFAVDTAQFARFYALQVLFFLAGAWAVYAALQEPLRRALWPTMLALLPGFVFLAVAVYLQPTTFFGIVGLLCWGLIVLAGPWLTAADVPARRKLLVLALGGVAGLVLLVFVLTTGLMTSAWALYRDAQLFNIDRVNQFWFYHFFYVLYYPSLWPFIGFLIFFGLCKYPRPAFLAFIIFSVGFLLNSFAGAKNLRYIAYAQPFLFMLFGFGLAAAWEWISDGLTPFKQQLERHLAPYDLAGRRLSDALLWGALVFALLSNAALIRTTTILAGVTMPTMEKPPVDWLAARPTLDPWLDRVDIVLTMADLEALYFLDGYDVLYGPSRLREVPTAEDFARDHRTGRPIIGSHAALELVQRCTRSGIFITNTHMWRTSPLNVALADFLEANMSRIEIPRATQVIAFTWDTETIAGEAAECRPVQVILDAAP
jgi:hypothetical protein